MGFGFLLTSKIMFTKKAQIPIRKSQKPKTDYYFCKNVILDQG